MPHVIALGTSFCQNSQCNHLDIFSDLPLHHCYCHLRYDFQNHHHPHLFSRKGRRRQRRTKKNEGKIVLPMRMTRFSGFFAQSILRWTSFMRSSVEIDSSASADIFLFIFLCCFCGGFVKKFLCLSSCSLMSLKRSLIKSKIYNR